MNEPVGQQPCLVATPPAHFSSRISSRDELRSRYGAVFLAKNYPIYAPD